MNPFSLQDKSVLITGASSGIGKAVAHNCSMMGAKVIGIGRDENKLRKAISELQGDANVAIRCDVTHDADLEEAVSLLPKLDGLVLCAGTLATVPTRFIDVQSLLSQFDTNYFSVALLMSKLQQSKRLNKGASIVLISSVAADGAAEVGNAIYSSTKAALQAYSRVLAKELVGRRIRVNCIAPGMIKTPFLSHFDVDAQQMADNEKKYPLGFGDPEDVAYAAVYLLSDASRWVTGTTLRLDGGLSL